jgi:hypothetical protein
MLEVTWAALLFGCMSSSLAEERGLPFCPADVREQLGKVLFKEVRTDGTGGMRPLVI